LSKVPQLPSITASSALKKILITGAASGFGYEAAMRLGGKGFDVIAAVETVVETYAQVQTLKPRAAASTPTDRP
jgi:NAD(P)-dependent dehydrogenase (short-subunit alcohol dehydrogenase family)